MQKTSMCEALAMTTPAALRELADRLDGVCSWLRNVDPAHEKAQGALAVGISEVDDIATQLRTAASEGVADEIPDAWMHTLCMEGGQTTSNLTFRKKHNFGKRGVDYDPSYTVTSAPLFTHPPEVARDAGRYRWLVKVWSAPFPLHPKLGKVLDAFKDDDKAKIDEAIDAAINHDAATSDAALRARAVSSIHSSTEK